MAIEMVFTEPEDVLCVKIKVPVVLAEDEVQVVVDNVTCLPELAKKVDHITTELRDLEARPVFVHEPAGKWADKIEEDHWDYWGHYPVGHVTVAKKIIVTGTLHKQIFYVNKDDQVKHFQEDIPFAKEVHLTAPAPVMDEDEVFAQFFGKKVDISWDLVKASRLHQTGVIMIKFKLVEERQIFVQVCPKPVEKKCPRRGNLVKDPSLEVWANANAPVFWGACNVTRTDVQHSGAYAALLGQMPGEMATLFQMVDRGIAGGAQYRLCFFANENIVGIGVTSFELEAAIIFYDENGVEVGSKRGVFTASQIPDEVYERFCIEATAPKGARSALVRFTFTPSMNNTNPVKIDDILFECVV